MCSEDLISIIREARTGVSKSLLKANRQGLKGKEFVLMRRYVTCGNLSKVANVVRVFLKYDTLPAVTLNPHEIKALRGLNSNHEMFFEDLLKYISDSDAANKERTNTGFLLVEAFLIDNNGKNYLTLKFSTIQKSEYGSRRRWYERSKHTVSTRSKEIINYIGIMFDWQKGLEQAYNKKLGYLYTRNS